MVKTIKTDGSRLPFLDNISSEDENTNHNIIRESKLSRNNVDSRASRRAQELLKNADDAPFENEDIGGWREKDNPAMKSLKQN